MTHMTHFLTWISCIANTIIFPVNIHLGKYVICVMTDV